MQISLFTIHVIDLEKSIQFYQDVLKMKIFKVMEPNEQYKLVFLRGEGEVIVELIEEKNLVQLDKVSSGVSIGIFVENMDDILEHLKSNKIKIKRGPISVPSGNKLLFIEDPNGVEVEFIEGKI